MAREIRVTVDDDEVFERMRERKQALDLSWEEVLHRGLSDESRADLDLDEQIERHVGQRIRNSLESAFGGLPEQPPDGPAPGGNAPDPPGGVDPAGTATPGDPTPGAGGPAPSAPTELDETVERLESAEDALLTFPFLDDDPRNTVPLRVDLETSADGLSVEVVAVRTGRSVADRNRFERGARQSVAESFATGETARLTLGDGAESYAVVPELAWRTAEGDPTVAEVTIREVVFGD
ncbi:hypothetical protein [Halobaculum sp. MBLA0143]|uniref:hypothetical protein n=1 Tax=Halobaculum sp. MBLA0143 TaxID=3079933 RepID=UPI003525A716